MGVVIAFSGAIGSRRTELAGAVAEALDWPRVKFSDFVKEQIRAEGGDPEDRFLLQRVGQQFVQHRLREFVSGVLAMQPAWEADGNLVVDGLRHTEVRLELLNQIGDSSLFYVHVNVDPRRREEGASLRGIEQQVLYKHDQALTEAQISRILPAYADLTLDGAALISNNVAVVLEKVAPFGVRIPRR